MEKKLNFDPCIISNNNIVISALKYQSKVKLEPSVMRLESGLMGPANELEYYRSFQCIQLKWYSKGMIFIISL